MVKNKKISLIDGSGFIFRAYYALPPLTSKNGTPVGAVLGFCNILLKLLEEKKSDKVVVIFDSAKKTFRNAIYGAYKANRGEPPEDLIPQFEIIREAVDAFKITRVELSGYEADDLIATYANFFDEKKWNVEIVSSDKDLMQLINKNITMKDPMKNKVIGMDEVLEKFGVYPNKVIDVQSLAGDNVDNIPGAPGIGIKTAASLVNEFGSLENILNNYSKIKQNKRRETIKNNIKNILISKQLVTLKSDIDIEIILENISETSVNNASLSKFFAKYGFNNLQAKIGNPQNKFYAQEKNTLVKSSYKAITQEKELGEIVNIIKKTGFFSIDTETDSIKANNANLVGISLAWQEGFACYIPLLHSKNISTNSLLNKEKVALILNPLLKDSSIIKIGQNLKYDEIVLQSNGFSEITTIEDTMLISYTLFSGLHNHNLDLLCSIYLNFEKIKYKDLVGSGKKQVPFSEVSIEKATTYSCEDADYTLRLWKSLKKLLIKNKLMSVYQNIEKPLVKVIAEMEIKGIKVDKKGLLKLSEEFKSDIVKLQKKIFNFSGEEFNINSTKQLGSILFENLDLPHKKKNKSGGFSTNSEVLELLMQEGFEIAELILKWREINKLKNTYTDSLVLNINEKTKRIHTTFQMTGAQTGRLSSTDPNLQNIPIKTENGKKIRKAFIAEEGCKLLCFDYSQIELRLLSQIANIASLKNAFLKNQDIHKLTASQILNIPIEKVSQEERRNAKAINFGIIYGLSAFGLAKQIGVSRSDAKKYIDEYFLMYPGIKEYMKKIKDTLHKDGYVKTLLGRKINIKDYNSKNPMIRNYAERQAINAPIQGTAADIIKRAMIKINNIKHKSELSKTNMLLQVHDELVFETSETDMKKIKKIITDIMMNAHKPLISLDIPLAVSVGEGKNWEEAH